LSVSYCDLAGDNCETFDNITQTEQGSLDFDSSQVLDQNEYTFKVAVADRVGNGQIESSGPYSIQMVTKYYMFGGQRVAMRRGTGVDSVVFYLHGDHLGSTSLITDESGNIISQARNLPFGETRWESGNSLTDFGFTGQRLDGYIKLYDYGARFYSAKLGRFISADSIIPNPANPMGYDRYAYVLNNPLNYVDPSGHICKNVGGRTLCSEDDGSPGYVSQKGKKVYSLNVEQATSIQRDQSDPIVAQESYDSQETGIDRYHSDLCGQISVSIIREAMTGETNTLGAVYWTNPTPLDVGTSAQELAYIAAKALPPGTEVTASQFRVTGTYEGGTGKRLSYEPALNDNWADIDGDSMVDYDYIQSMIYTSIFQGNYIIIGGYLSTSTGRLKAGGVCHWVVISAVSPEGFEVVNPYYNRIEEYSWDYFWDGVFDNSMLIIKPPRPENAY
jgi:RHS repeat-associated protein